MGVAGVLLVRLVCFCLIESWCGPGAAGLPSGGCLCLCQRAFASRGACVLPAACLPLMGQLSQCLRSPLFCVVELSFLDTLSCACVVCSALVAALPAGRVGFFT